jgi:hypothetical protein
MGAALLRKPTKLAKMVAGIAAAVELPVTVKIRTGEQALQTKQETSPMYVRHFDNRWRFLGLWQAGILSESITEHMPI